MRAKRGGETGMNGERYEGGQFLPNTDLPKIAKLAKKVGTGKQEIAPYVWEVPPDGKWSLMWKYGTVWAWSADKKTVRLNDNVNVNYFGATYLAEASEAAQKWNNGERWC